MSTNQDPAVASSDRLLDAWAHAFVAGASWRESLRDGMSAIVEIVRADPDAVVRCPLLGATRPGERSSARREARERARERVLAVMHQQWARRHAPPAPSLYFEVFAGEMCALVQRSLAGPEGYDDLPEAAVAMWGPGAPPASCEPAAAAGR